MTSSKYLERADEALAELDNEKADQLFLELVVAIENAVSKNQKEMANELQRIAKDIEAAGKSEESVRFKQRTCEVMLRRSMEERMAARRNAAAIGGGNVAAAVAPAPATVATKLLSQMIFVTFVPQPQAYAALMQTADLNLERRILSDGSRWMRSKDSQIILLAKNEALSGSYTAFVAPNRDVAQKYFETEGASVEGAEVNAAGLKFLLMKDKFNQRFLLAGAEILQNM